MSQDPFQDDEVFWGDETLAATVAPPGWLWPAPPGWHTDRSPVTLRVNGRPHTVEAGTTVMAALLQTDVFTFRKSVTGAPRGPLCGMGTCFECRVTIDGVPQRLACMTWCAAGMEVAVDDA